MEKKEIRELLFRRKKPGSSGFGGPSWSLVSL